MPAALKFDVPRGLCASSSRNTTLQVACDPPGNISLELETTPAGNLVAHPLEVAGAGSISAMDIRAAGVRGSVVSHAFRVPLICNSKCPEAALVPCRVEMAGGWA